MIDPDASPRWPHESTVVLVIHGIGAQRRFEMLDSMAIPLWHALEERQGRVLEGEHRVASDGHALRHTVRLARGPEDPAPIDLREYYWADKTVGAAELGDVVDWLLAVADGARRYYTENLAMEQRLGAGKGAPPSRRTYLKHLGWLLRALGWFPIGVLRWVVGWWSPLVLVLNPLFRWVREGVVEYLGDIAIYTASDERSPLHAAREAILDGAVDEIRAALEDPRVSRVAIAGHSLGSVIAYDALNRINRLMNLGTIDPALASKIRLFLTFGSPLDKIAFFFREHPGQDAYVRRQILAHHHGFKVRRLDDAPAPRRLADPFRPFLDHVHWTNYWNALDPVSGPLDFYALEENIELDLHAGRATAHTSYVRSAEMFRSMVDRLVGAEVPHADVCAP